jgi:hypothetical protein
MAEPSLGVLCVEVSPWTHLWMASNRQVLDTVSSTAPSSRKRIGDRKLLDRNTMEGGISSQIKGA